MRRTVGSLAVGLAALSLSACAAVTTSATNVGSTSATLNARGHTNGTPAHYEFQYSSAEAALGTGFGQQTPTRGPIPPHVSGPFSEPVSGLSPGHHLLLPRLRRRQHHPPRRLRPNPQLHHHRPRRERRVRPAGQLPDPQPARRGRDREPPGARQPRHRHRQPGHRRRLGAAQPRRRRLRARGQLPHRPRPDPAIAAGNFTGAGRHDIVTTNTTGISVLLGNGNGNGGLAPAVNYALPGVPQSVVVGDFNGDGHPDIATFENLPPTPNPTNSYGNTPAGVVSVLLGHGDGTFGTPINTTVIPAAPCGVHDVCPTATDISLAAGALQTGSNRTDLILGRDLGIS